MGWAIIFDSPWETIYQIDYLGHEKRFKIMVELGLKAYFF
jgi:hypothetical protein